MRLKNPHFITAAVLLCLAAFLLTPFPWTKARSARYGAGSALSVQNLDAQVRLINYIDSCKSNRIDSMLTRAYRFGAFSGQVIYAENGKVLYNKCFGFSDVRRGRDSITGESRFQLASLSKPFTAVAIMQLYQDGALNIYDPVQKYLKDFPHKNITVKDLLQHRSGIPNYVYIAEKYWPTPKTPMTNSDLVPFMNQYAKNLEFTPGSRFKYCNTNYAYLAGIVEKVSGLTFADYFDRYIAQPLGMTHTFVYNAFKPETEKVVGGYSYSRRNGFYKRQPNHIDGIVGDKGLFSTAEDILKFDQALYDPNFLADSILKLMFTPSEPITSRNNGVYGMGFRIHQDTSGLEYPFHNGWWKGFRTYFTHDVNHGRTLIWLCNRSDVTVQPYIDEIFRISDTYSSVEQLLAKGVRAKTAAPDRPQAAAPQNENPQEKQALKREETYGSK